MILDYLLEILFPKRCISCNSSSDWFCQKCISTVEFLDDNFIPPPPYLSAVIAIAKFKGSLKEAIHAFKYESVKELGHALGDLAIQHLSDNCLNFVRRRIVVPVPLHKWKLVDRGFNQSLILGERIAQRLNLVINKNVLIKTRSTSNQVDLKKEERKNNLKGAYKVTNPSAIKNKRILLIDDVLTTGSTLSECAKTLKKAGARDVAGLVLALD